MGTMKRDPLIDIACTLAAVLMLAGWVGGCAANGGAW